MSEVWEHEGAKGTKNAIPPTARRTGEHEGREGRGRPIIFDGEMVRAILEGRKTQTRRVMAQARDEVGEWADAVCRCAADGSWIAWWSTELGVSAERWQQMTDQRYPKGGGFRCPYGSTGDRLWVRETWARGRMFADGREVNYRADGDLWTVTWRSAGCMPFSLCRIGLEVVEVCAERLQGITAVDCLAEGIGMPGDTRLDVFAEFERHWDALNAKRGYGWAKNPWVWVIEFRRVA